MNNQTYYNKSGKKVLEYVTNDTVTLDLPFIMTVGKQLTLNMPYMKLEKFLADTHIAAVRLLGVKDIKGLVFIEVQELETERKYTLSSNMEIDDWWLWSLADLETICSI